MASAEKADLRRNSYDSDDGSSWSSSSSDQKLGTRVEVSVILEPGSSLVNSRLTIRVEETWSESGRKVREVLDPGTYQEIFRQVDLEVSRRK